MNVYWWICINVCRVGELLQLLISRKMFAEAREWAKSSGIVGDTIVFEEVIRNAQVRAQDDRAVGSFYKESLCFNTMPCRHMPLPVHF